MLDDLAYIQISCLVESRRPAKKPKSAQVPFPNLDYGMYVSAFSGYPPSKSRSFL